MPSRQTAKNPNCCQSGLCVFGYQVGLLACWWQVRAATVRHFRRHADTLAQRWMRVDGFADVDGISTHLNRQGHFANHVACMGADHAAAQNLAVAMRLGRVIKQQFGDAFVATIGNGAAGSVPREQAFLDLDALRLGLVFGQANHHITNRGIDRVTN